MKKAEKRLLKGFEKEIKHLYSEKMDGEQARNYYQLLSRIYDAGHVANRSVLDGRNIVVSAEDEVSAMSMEFRDFDSIYMLPHSKLESDSIFSIGTRLSMDIGCKAYLSYCISCGDIIGYDSHIVMADCNYVYGTLLLNMNTHIDLRRCRSISGDVIVRDSVLYLNKDCKVGGKISVFGNGEIKYD